MWSKGAVVVVKRGDEAMANAIEEGMSLALVSSKEVEDIKRENFFLKRQNTKNNKRKIIAARHAYAIKRRRFKWKRLFVDIYALTVYGLTMFFDRYMRIHKE